MRMLHKTAALAAVASISAGNLAWSQVQPVAAPVLQPTVPATVPPPPSVPAVVVAPVGGSLLIPEGTEVRIRFEDDLSSKTASQGDRFTISLADSITLSDGFVVPAGYRGVGEVTNAEKNGMMGKGGQLNVRFEYISIGDARLRLRGSQGREGAGAIGSTIVLTVLFGPLGLLMKGKNIEIKRGQVITAYVDSNAMVALPLAAAPTR